MTNNLDCYTKSNTNNIASELVDGDDVILHSHPLLLDVASALNAY